MTRTHTPGPWQATPGVNPAVWLIDSTKDGAITEIRPIRDSATNEANANLISAAPALLEAAEAAVAALTQPATFPADINAAVLWLTNAIAAAKGGAQ